MSSQCSAPYVTVERRMADAGAYNIKNINTKLIIKELKSRKVDLKENNRNFKRYLFTS